MRGEKLQGTCQPGARQWYFWTQGGVTFWCRSLAALVIARPGIRARPYPATRLLARPNPRVGGPQHVRSTRTAFSTLATMTRWHTDPPLNRSDQLPASQDEVSGELTYRYRYRTVPVVDNFEAKPRHVHEFFRRESWSSRAIDLKAVDTSKASCPKF